ncbi:hypothetical protein J0695_23875, partial [Streptomyces beijiangensis]|nr:hypothetical protein [Streptomyces beijiangensis]
FTGQALDDAMAELSKGGLEPHSQLIAEEFIAGRELHVDALWHGKEPLFLIVSAYYEPRLSLLEGKVPDEPGVPLDGSYIIPREQNPDLYEKVLHLHRVVNGALGVERAVTHLELFERPDGQLVFSEIATRLGGGWIGPLLSEYLGYNVQRAVADGLLLGRLDPPCPTHPYLGALHLRPTGPGTITAIPDVAQMLSKNGVLRAQCWRAQGDPVQLDHPSDWCAFVVLGADSREQYEALARQVVTEFPVEVEPFASREQP